MILKPFLILISLCLLFACNKDAAIVYDTCPMVVENCKNIPPYKGPGTGYKYEWSDSFFYDKPSINPNNPNEFAFFFTRMEYRGIFTYNMQTKREPRLPQVL
jgi:hypothetical protein